MENAKLENDRIILSIKNLTVEFENDLTTVRALDGVNLNIISGQSIGLVGESGCGKTITAYSILRILPPNGKIKSGEIYLKKEDDSIIDICKFESEDKEIQQIRGGDISIIFQEPMSSLSPVHTIYDQISEGLFLHTNKNKKAARKRVIELLNMVDISNPEKRIEEFPFQFSGGMRQRVMIAMALACNPRLLLADEPTTALDVTTQAQVLKIIKQMQSDLNLSLMLITHDLSVIAHMVDYIYIIYLGKVIESGKVKEIFNHPYHPYTKGLLKSIPRLKGTQNRLASIKGSVPDPRSKPAGCPFNSRCNSIIGDICYNKQPAKYNIVDDHWVSCFIYSDEKMSIQKA